MQNAWGNTSIVISDTHLGTETTTIRKSKDIDKFFSSLKDLTSERNGKITEFILLGDIFDLHLCDYKTSISSAYYFFNKIIELTEKNKGCICYIPGNHDHSFWLLHYFYNSCGEYLKLLSNGQNVQENPYSPYQYDGRNSFFRGVLRGRRVKFALKYSYHETKDKQNNIYFFTHGHFFDEEQKVLSGFIYKAIKEILRPGRIAKSERSIEVGVGLAKSVLESLLEMLGLRKTATPEVTAESINALYNAIQYECLALLSQTSMSRTVLKEAYQTLIKASCKPVDEYLSEIHKYLNDYLPAIGNSPYGDAVSVIIFGHTHLAGINTRPFSRTNEKEALVFNTGSWTTEDGAKNSMEGNLVIISEHEQYPLLYSYRNGRLDLHSDTLKLLAGLIPRKSSKTKFF